MFVHRCSVNYLDLTYIIMEHNIGDYMFVHRCSVNYLDLTYIIMEHLNLLNIGPSEHRTF